MIASKVAILAKRHIDLSDIPDPDILIHRKTARQLEFISCLGMYVKISEDKKEDCPLMYWARIRLWKDAHTVAMGHKESFSEAVDEAIEELRAYIIEKADKYLEWNGARGGG